MIQKDDKDNSVVFANTNDHISKMELIVADTSNFKKIKIDDSKVLDHLIHMKMKMVELLKKRKEKHSVYDKFSMVYTLQAQEQVFYMVLVKSTKLLFMVSHLLALYCQLLEVLIVNSQ